MSTDKLTGNFNYYSLRQAVKKHGVKESDLNSALKKIADANNIDDITKLDGSEKISVSTSVFAQFINIGITNPFINKPEETLEIYSSAHSDLLNPNKVISTNINDLSEVFNDDEYEVVDYDDFYSFNSGDEAQNKDEVESKEDNANSQQKGMDFDTFKENYDNIFSSGVAENIKNDDSELKNIFNIFDKNSDSYLDSNELLEASMTSTQNAKSEFEIKNEPNSEGDEKVDLGNMETDMSGDSFNPQ